MKGASLRLCRFCSARAYRPKSNCEVDITYCAEDVSHRAVSQLQDMAFLVPAAFHNQQLLHSTGDRGKGGEFESSRYGCGCTQCYLFSVRGKDRKLSFGFCRLAASRQVGSRRSLMRRWKGHTHRFRSPHQRSSGSHLARSGEQAKHRPEGQEAVLRQLRDTMYRQAPNSDYLS